MLGVIAEGEYETAVGEGGRIDTMVKQGQITKEQAKEYKETLTEMQETFSKYDNESLKQLTPQARKQLAEIAYYKDATQRMHNETIENKKAQIDKVNETIKDPKLRKQQIDFINKEFAMQEKVFQETIANYEKIIPQLYSDSKSFYENQLKEVKEKSKLTKEEWHLYTEQIWKITPVISRKDHSAPYPEEIPKRLIKLFSFKDDIILDCFAGSGTTLKVAKELKRSFIGYEIDEQYKNIIEAKLNENWNYINQEPFEEE